MNPILQQIGKQNTNNYRNMFSMIRNARNPQALLNQMVQNNPQYRQVMQMIQNSGGDAKTAFYNECSRRGVNPDEILNALK